ncbi:MAG: hypothetical protein K6B65_00145 [Bacilli bacterium]|nr:hypothetical protein [Bacilli bacterium]
MGQAKRKGQSKANRATFAVLLNCFLILLGVGGVTSGTMAWFVSNRSVTTEVSSFTIQSPGGIEYDLYFLDTFSVNAVIKDGNWNNRINKFAGYEVSYTNNAATFTKINYSNNGSVQTITRGGVDYNPTSIEELWPAHKLTYALVITSGSVSGFSLSSFSETTSNSAKVSAEKNVSLTWAIDIRGQAYSVSPMSSPESVTADIQSAYADYRRDYYSSLTDRFAYAETYPESATPPTLPLSIVNQGASEEGREILFFTIEFSNAESTFYELDSNTGYYVQNDNGNSNCYENLRLNNLVFTLS